MWFFPALMFGSAALTVRPPHCCVDATSFLRTLQNHATAIVMSLNFSVVVAYDTTADYSMLF